MNFAEHWVGALVSVRQQLQLHEGVPMIVQERECGLTQELVLGHLVVVPKFQRHVGALSCEIYARPIDFELVDLVPLGIQGVHHGSRNPCGGQFGSGSHMHNAMGSLATTSATARPSARMQLMPKVPQTDAVS
eukprot:CAMPEP_0206635108 /NCGR_PEP_ID=MMETSP0325_2-20121206/70394_1 /ASSEMBLY_ACC=CAM_ASM_000347 /TAXON_ID=2866 /ORGANISM="Crypthecodinium cohnii, Strain Seligo" /LENGTH=132 /DNA_ID=CAMNT_0054160939 /DNA_START=131 /DNA_END=527 /DNA_ORIENTATION=+